MQPTTSYISVTDQFCGAGGSSLGASMAGCEVVLAMNHWKLAIETHNTNFPDTMHVLLLRSDETFTKFEVKFRVSVPLKGEQE